jgi:hypothetical protein
MEERQEERGAAHGAETTTTRLYGPPEVGKGALQWSPGPPEGWAPDERYVPPPGEQAPAGEVPAPRLLAGLLRVLPRPHRPHPGSGSAPRP